jgi:hypothetical protein
LEFAHASHDSEDEREPLDRRARAYLHANCSHRHRGFGGNAQFELLSMLKLAETGTIDARPAQGDLGMRDAWILAPGDPGRSLIAHRMALRGQGRMPPLASSVVDREAVQLIRAWIDRPTPIRSPLTNPNQGEGIIHR